MSGRHLKALIRAYRDRDDLAFRRAAQAIIEEEEAKRHTTLARDLRHLLAAGAGPMLSMPDSVVSLPDPPKDRDSSLPLAEIRTSDLRLADLVLDEALASHLHHLVREVEHWHLLDRHAIARRNRVLLYGPPGCGKTSIAAALASELNRPLVTVRVEGVVSSYLGETATNLRKVIDFAQSGAYVVLFDEFDSLGKDRDDPNDHGELRRVVNAVLQMIDAYSGPSLLVAATNHASVLDEAMWRRFDEVFEVALPSVTQIEELLMKSLGGAAITDHTYMRVAAALEGLPHAAAAHVANAAGREAIMAGRSRINDDDLWHAVERTTQRRWI